MLKLYARPTVPLGKEFVTMTGELLAAAENVATTALQFVLLLSANEPV